PEHADEALRVHVPLGVGERRPGPHLLEDVVQLGDREIGVLGEAFLAVSVELLRQVADQLALSVDGSAISRVTRPLLTAGWRLIGAVHTRLRRARTSSSPRSCRWTRYVFWSGNGTYVPPVRVNSL